ncbi:hypothetical protein KLO01_26860 [Knoellia locipacati]|uniref:Uncharacterized protein n=1 Tax=Knoellia locipacati TaxID=882824 RepID=A0A512T374_9MICO|nr:hypothetical protein KLO01_26860 [Knoellia locipacati]
MPQHIQPVLLLRRHRLDLVTVGEDVGEVAQLATDPGDEHVAPALEEVARRRPRLHRSLVSGDVDTDLG